MKVLKSVISAPLRENFLSARHVPAGMPSVEAIITVTPVTLSDRKICV